MNVDQEARGLVEEGFSLLKRGQLDAGASLIERARLISPNDSKVINATGVVHLKRGDSWSALKIFWIAAAGLEHVEYYNGTKHDEEKAAVGRNMDLALAAMEKDGLAHLKGGAPARAKEIFLRALEFSTENSRLRQGFIQVLEANGEQARAFNCAKRLALELVDSQSMNVESVKRLGSALRIFLPNRLQPAFKTAKADLSEIIGGLPAKAGNLSTLKKVILIFASN